MARRQLIKEDILRSASVLLIVGIWVAIMALPYLIDPARITESAFRPQDGATTLAHGRQVPASHRNIALSSISLEAQGGADVSVSAVW